MKRILFAVIILLNSATMANSWYSQLFPYNAGSYNEATVTFNARTWRLLDYSYVGYNLGDTGLRSGIPCTTINIAGTGDITAELQTAVDTLEATGGRVVIPPGIFTVSSRITVNRRNISIEGAGSGRTVLNIPSSIVLLEGANDFQGVFTFEYTADGWNKGWPDRGAILSMVNGAIPEGSMYVTGLTNLANVAIGDWVTIQQYWWQEFSTQNSDGVWQYYPPTYNRETTFTYLRRITNKDASGVFIDAPVPFHLDSANNPIHIRRSGPTAPSYQMLDNVGVSGVSIVFADNNSGTDSRPRGAGVVMEGVVNGWVYDVQVVNFPRYGFYFEYDARISFINCSAKKTQDYGGDGYGYGYHNYGSQNVLINSCYAEDVRHAYIFQKPLANYCVVANSESVDCRQGEDTHHSFCHAILRDNLRHKNGNKMVGYNRGTTSTNAYETYGTGVNWNVTGDGIGGVWESAIFSMNPAPYPAPYTHGIMVGGPDLYRVYDNGSHKSGTYIEGDLVNAAAGLQVGPNGDKNELYEGLGQAGLEPLSLYAEQLKNRLGTVPAVWDGTCGGGPNVPAATPSPDTGPDHLVFDSEHAAWGNNFGSACPMPLNTLTPGTNLDDLGQLHSSPEGLRVDVTAGSNWTPMFTFGGPDLDTSSYLSVEFWVYPSNSAMEFYLNLINDDTGTALGGSVTVNGSFAQGGTFIINTWNRVTVPLANFGYSGMFNGLRFSRTANLPGTFYMDDIYLVLNGTPTFTVTPTRTNTAGGTNTFTRTPSRTPTRTGTRTLTGTPVITATFTGSVSGTPTRTITNSVTPTFTRTASPSATRTNTVIFTSTRTPTSTPITGCGKRLLAYYPYWMSTYRQDKIPYTKLTHICHAFVQPQADGSIAAPVGPPAYLEPALITNAHANGVKVLVSVGGADSVADANFRTISASPALRTAFADALEAFCRTYGYDGVDLDWEFPQDATDRANQNLMVQAIRTKFNSSAAPAPSWLITAAVSSGNWYGQWNDYATLNSYMDFYNVMTYDYHGSWSAHSGHNSPIYQGTDPDAWDCIDYNMNYMLVTRGVPADKMNLGMPFYGRNFNNSETLYDACGGSCADTYYNYADMYTMIGNGWTYHWDAASMVPYLTYDSGTGVLSYDNPQSIGLKVDYGLTTRALGGVFMWDLSADYISGTGQPLMDAMYNAYSSFCGTAVPSVSASATASVSPVNTNTRTPSATASKSQTPTNTRTWTASVSPQNTFTITMTRTNTASPQGTLTNSPTRTSSPTLTMTFTGTRTRTVTPQITPTNTPTRTATTVATPTPSTSYTPPATSTFTATSTETEFAGSPSFTPTATITGTPDPCTCPSYFGKNINSVYPAGIYNYVESNKYVLVEDALVRALHVYVTSTTGAGRVRMAIYSDNGAVPNSVPQNMLVESSDVTVVQGWNVLDIADTSLTAGTYWIAVQAENGVSLEYDEGTMGNEAWASLAYGAFPAVYPVGSWWNYEFSMYADYCPVVCGTPTYTRTMSPTATETHTASPVVSPTITATLVLSCECPDELGMQYVAANYTGAANFLVANWYPMFEDGTAMSMEIYSTTGGGNAILAIYGNSTVDFNPAAPAALVCQSAPFALSAGWNTVTVPQANLQANTIYWLAYITDTAAYIAAEAGSTGDMYYRTFTYGTLPASFGASTANTINFSIHVNYCPAVCPPTPTPTGTETPVVTATDTPAGTLTNTPVVTGTFTYTSTPVPTATETPVDTPSEIPTSTATPPPTETDTPVPSTTFTLTATMTATPTLTRTMIPFTPTYTVTPSATPVIEDTMEIIDVLHYPNPYSGGTGDLIISFDITRPANLITVSIYSCGYRKVIEKQIPGYFLREAIVTVERDRFERLAGGVYYTVIKGENGAEKAKSKPGKLVIIR